MSNRVHRRSTVVAFTLPSKFVLFALPALELLLVKLVGHVLLQRGPLHALLVTRLFNGDVPIQGLIRQLVLSFQLYGILLYRSIQVAEAFGQEAAVDGHVALHL